MILQLLKNKIQRSECNTSCTEVVMSAFIKAIVNADYSGLAKRGNPTIEDLANAWEIVFNQYLTISGDTHIKQLLALLKEISFLTNRLELIEIIVQQLITKHIPGLADQLKAMGFRFEYADNESLARELQLTITQSKTQLIQLNQAKAELEELRKGEGNAATEMDYELQLSELSKFQGFQLNPDVLTVSGYCALLRRFKAFYKPR